MTLEISVNPETETRLREMAASAGTDVSVFVSQLLEQAATKPSLEELLAPLRRQFAESGAIDEELIDEITAAQRDYRGEQKKQELCESKSD
jgi:hypothetical protein